VTAAPNIKNAANASKKPLKAKVYCPDGTAHLIDFYSINQCPEVIAFIEAFQ
jgi:hypothetical protein